MLNSGQEEIQLSEVQLGKVALQSARGDTWLLLVFKTGVLQFPRISVYNQTRENRF